MWKAVRRLVRQRVRGQRRRRPVRRRSSTSCFKVETHNHPSALEPYGGANTGIGGVIRDPLGTGLGAKPICNTDVFCFAPPDTPAETLPPGVLHPRRVMQGVVAGVRDYGNRMGIPTVNGAVYFDARYLGNPLVYCGNVGLIPRDKSFKEPQPGDLIVAVGGRTGRDGIHGATFSSAELTSESETLSGGAVQIGNAITEKKVLDVLLQARDRGLYQRHHRLRRRRVLQRRRRDGREDRRRSLARPGAAEVRGPVVHRDLDLRGPGADGPGRAAGEVGRACERCARAEGVEATVIGEFVPTGRLKLKYDDKQVADLAMEFLHDGRPPVVREAVYDAAGVEATRTGSLPTEQRDSRRRLAAARSSARSTSASKEWIIRQYDHEVQGGSVIKPLVGVANDGPSDAAVVRPVLGVAARHRRSPAA